MDIDPRADRGATDSESSQSGAPDTTPIPAAWGSFRLIGELGRGGFGRVYRAWDDGLAREVAIKVVQLSDPTDRADALREGQMLARVRHYNVVTVHSVHAIGDEVGLVMELIRGESLARVVRRAGPMGAEEATFVGMAMCQALAAVHGADLLHRDVKAQNVMRESGGRIVLMDFGAGRAALEAQTGKELTGTPLYLAPELFGGGRASPASDLYSLGVLLHFLVTGAYPIEGRTLRDFAVAHRAGPTRRLADRRPDLPVAFVRVVERTLSADPTERPASAGALLAELSDAAAASRQSPAKPEEIVPDAGSRRTTRSRSAAWSIGAVGGVAAAIVLFGFLTSRAYDLSFGLGDFASDSFWTWLELGMRAFVPPAVYAGMVILAWWLLRTCWQLLTPMVPPLERASSRISSTISGVFSHRLGPPAVGVRWLLVVQALVVLVLAWTFRDVLTAMVTPLDRGDPSLLRTLDIATERVLYYQFLVSLTLAGSIVAWRKAWSAFGASLDTPTLFAGIAIVVVLLAALAVPYRLFYLTRALPEFVIAGERCFETGRRNGQTLLFCPDVVPDPERGRVRIVNTPDLPAPKGPGSPFSPRQ